jgi:hypothetical protein
LDRTEFERFGNSQIQSGMCSFLHELLGHGISSSADSPGAKLTYDDVDRFVEVDDFAFPVDNRDRTDATFRKHMNHVKYGGLERSGSEWI